MLLSACADNRKVLIDKDYKVKELPKGEVIAGNPQSAPVPDVAAVPIVGGAASPSPSTVTCKFLDKGLASWYGHELAGNHTANGEMFNPDGISAAHPSLPFGSIVHVKMDNGKGNPQGVTVRINDRGPFVKGRIIDLSWGAAKKLGMMDTQPVKIYLCP